MTRSPRMWCVPLVWASAPWLMRKASRPLLSVVLFGIWLGSNIVFEAALLIALMGFVGTVAVAKYLLRGDIIE